MTKLQKSQDGGFVLISALVAVGVLTLLGATIANMAITSKNAEEKWVLRDRSSSLAQSGLEKIRWGIYEKFNEYYYAAPDAQMSSKFDWFNTISATSIGTAGYTYDFPQGSTFVDEDGETPALWTDGVYSASLTPYQRDDNRWDILISVTANFEADDGTVLAASTRTVEELVTYASDTSEVFGYAYFINNHGWFYGSTIQANGPIRSNGDFNMMYGPTVNGDVIASVNTDNGATGQVYGSDYNNDTADSYNNDGSLSGWARPTLPQDYKVKNNHGHGNNVDGVDVSNPGGSKEGLDTDPLIDDENKGSVVYEPLMQYGYDDAVTEFEEESALEMPLLGDLSGYKSLALAQSGKIEIWNELSGVYEEITLNGTYSGVGPDGLAGTADDGVMVLTGDIDHPIRISGPVVAENDVVIKGYYSGQGTIYSGRNVHIVGDVVASNPPVWDKSLNATEADFVANDTKDMLCLAAKGNVMLGNVDDIKNSDYIKPPFTKAYTTDATDYDIGYSPNSGTQWDGDYSAVDGGKRIGEITELLSGTLSTTSGSTVVYGTGTNFTSELSSGDKLNFDGVQYTVTSVENDGEIILNSSVTTTTSGIVIAADVVEVDRHYYEPSISETEFQDLLQKDGDGNHEKITQVDAISYTNHLYSGQIGEATFNGSIVSRDEAIIFSGSLNLNWDMRALSGADGNAASISLPKQLKKPSTIYWRER